MSLFKVAKRKDPTPEIVDHCAARLIERGRAKNKRQAYAICVAHLQRTGYLKPGTMKLTEKGRRRNAYHLQHRRAIDLHKVASENSAGRRALKASAYIGSALTAAFLANLARIKLRESSARLPFSLVFYSLPAIGAALAATQFANMGPVQKVLTSSAAGIAGLFIGRSLGNVPHPSGLTLLKYTPFPMLASAAAGLGIGAWASANSRILQAILEESQPQSRP